MSDFVLYSYFRSSSSYRVRIALNLKNLSHTIKPVHLLNNGGEQNHPEFKALNPSGEVPVLVHKTFVVSQSLAILDYLDTVSSHPLLAPKDPQTKALALQICGSISGTQTLQNVGVLQHLTKNYSLSEEQKSEWLKKWIQKGFESLEPLYQKHSQKYSLGSEMTWADCFLAPQGFAAQRFGVSLNSYPHLARVYTNLLKEPAVQKAHPYRQIDTPEEMKSLELV